MEGSGPVNPSDHFLLAVDENLGYLPGSMLIFDQASSAWKSRTPDADLLFRLSGVVDLVEHMRDVVTLGGQFLRGFENEIAQSLNIPPVGDKAQTCLQALHHLLAQGDALMQPLSAGVDPNRRFLVRLRPEVSSAAIRLDTQGKLQNRFGQPMSAPWQAVGQWLASEFAYPFYLSSLTLDPIRNKATYNH